MFSTISQRSTRLWVKLKMTWVLVLRRTSTALVKTSETKQPLHPPTDVMNLFKRLQQSQLSKIYHSLLAENKFHHVSCIQMALKFVRLKPTTDLGDTVVDIWGGCPLKYAIRLWTSCFLASQMNWVYIPTLQMLLPYHLKQ